MSEPDLSHYMEGLRILYAEDENISRQILLAHLNRFNIKLDSVENGQAALELYQQKEYDLLISDIGMPEMDGIALCEQVKIINPHQRILITSAYNDSDRLLKLIDIGVNNFVLKPFAAERLQQVLLRISQDIYARRELEKIREVQRREYEYAVQEQTKAHAKQKSIITNDLKNDTEFDTQIIYKPSDILSGDSYSIHKQDDGSLLLYVIDAMGHGILPSLTSFAVAFMVKQAMKEGKNFQELANSLLSHLNSLLNEYEQLSCIFVHIDSKREKLNYFSAGMYPGFVLFKDHIEEMKANNMPIMDFSTKIEISELNISGFKRLLIYSDALIETGSERISPSELKRRVAEPGFIEELMERAFNADDCGDDLTTIYLKRMP